MKKYLYPGLITIVILISIKSFAQNTFPSSGNVGIGTTSPVVPLHLSQNTTDGYTIRLENSNASGTYKFTQFMQLGSNGFGIADWPNAGVLEGAANGGLVLSALAGDLKLQTSDPRITRMTIKNSSGKIGIGTTSPADLLDVASSSGNIAIRITNNGNTSTDYSAMRIFQGGTEKGVIYTNQENMFINRSGSGNLLLANSGGNVGIGTTTPQAKLAVNGDIYAKKVKVTQTGWPDFVFLASYRLRPLFEVEKFINQHHHLPDIPSAEEIENNGLDLGDNQKAVVAKIEELTLYILQLNKKLEALEKEIRQLKVNQN